MKQPKIVVFDVGRVLLEWDVIPLFSAALGDEVAAQAFIEETDFLDWNERMDEGETYADALATAAQHYPQHQALFELYRDKWDSTIHGAIDGTVAILEALRLRPQPLYAITNFGAENWPRACDRFPFLRDSFADVVVSGDVKLLKPDPAIFHLLLDRNDLDAADCLFVDDSAKNVDAARSVGMHAIQFTGPKALQKVLELKGLL